MLFNRTFFFFKQKTAYAMRISDWSSDVCSSGLCRRVNPQAGCNPIEAVTLKFASPVARATALAATLSTADGQRLAATASDSDRNDPWLPEVHFAGPLPQNVDATLALPAGLTAPTGARTRDV